MPTFPYEIVSIFALIIWCCLLLARGMFWLGAVRDSGPHKPIAEWPAVAAIVPARNEADCVADSITSLLRQDYPGALTIILVDDASSDGTAAVAQRAADAVPGAHHLKVVSGAPLPAGWTGKLWAVKQGTEAAAVLPAPPDYLLLTDADIVHDPDSLRWLAAHAVTHGLVLTSLMAKLRCVSLVECIHVPAFIFFFQMLYPFARVNRPHTQMAAAAGGCMLVKSESLRRIGGIDAIRGALIDDCTLAAKLKTTGPIWLGLTKRVHSIRHYDTFEDVRQMISRSAYAQLRYSPLLLLGTTLGMALTYLAPPLFGLFGGGLAQIFGLIEWALMALAFQPTLRFYRLSPLWGLALPAIASLYMLYTLDSAYQYTRGRGGHWKGRAQANLARDP
jgi:hopene-associated glycosyltransferase HpnB